MKKAAAILLLVLAAGSPCFAQGESAASLYNRANALYADGRYSEAIDLYKKALSGGLENADVEYNLGNAYLKNNPPNIAEAVLHYERARKIEPRDPDIRHNILYVNTLIKGKLPEAERSFLNRAWEYVIGNLTPGEALGALSFLYFVLTAALIVYFVTRARKLRKITLYIAAVSMALLFLQTPVSWGVLKLARNTQAVILEDNLAARSGPGQDNQELFKLFEGMVVVEHEGRLGWTKVTLPNGLAGWIPADKAEEI